MLAGLHAAQLQEHLAQRISRQFEFRIGSQVLGTQNLGRRWGITAEKFSKWLKQIKKSSFDHLYFYHLRGIIYTK